MGFAAIQTLVGVTQLSELGIDISKNWLTYLINNLGDPVANQDAATKKYVDDNIGGITALSELTIDTSKNWLTYLIKGLGDPVDAQDAVTKAYLVSQLALYLLLSGGTMSGNIAMGNNKVTGLAAPTADGDAARKVYVDDLVWTYHDIEPVVGHSVSVVQVWEDWDLSAYVPAGTFAVLLEVETSETYLVGARKNGTALNRRWVCDSQTMHTIVECDANRVIEVFDNLPIGPDAAFNIFGYWI